MTQHNTLQTEEPSRSDEIRNAFNLLAEELDAKDGEYFKEWQTTIGAVFFDECKERGSEMRPEALKQLCNDAAKRFLKSWIALAKTPKEWSKS